MQILDGQLVLSPTDLTKHQECRHLTRLDLAVADGLLAKPMQTVSEELELIFRLGLAHEERYLESLRAEGLSIVEIATRHGADGRRQAEAETLDAMRRGVDVVYQATFFNGAWGGQADFLRRVEKPSSLGEWSYEIADTKLTRRMKVAALLQMVTYAERLAELQGREPDHVHVVTGDGEERPWRLVDVAAYARRARERMRAFVDHPPDTEPVPVAHCAQCTWQQHCEGEWRRADDLSLVAGMRGDHRDALRGIGITTLAQLAEAAPDQLKNSGIGAAARARLREQAAEQMRERRTGVPSRTLLSPEENRGLLRLPEPDDGDLYLDFEGDPYAEDGEGREYLAGLGDTEGGFTALWAHDRDAERAMVVELIDRITAAWRRSPGMHVYHYAPYEVTALKRLTGRYGVREAELDALLRAERFVDLYPVVRQSMRISKSSYSIKKLEAFYWGAIRGQNADVADAMASVLAYERWLVDPQQKTLDDIEAYNKDDVDSTRALHRWLEEQRLELEALQGSLDRPVPPDKKPSDPVSDAEAAETALAERLRAAGHPLLGDLVQWHRREAKPGWWEVFRLDALEDEELVDDGSALGGLSEPVFLRPEKKSSLYEYGFPVQDTKLRVGDTALDVRTHASAGAVFEIDADAGRVVLKRQGPAVVTHGLGPSGPIVDGVLRRAIADTADDVLAGRHCLGTALLDRRVPADTEPREGESTTDAIVRLGLALDGEVLAIQGPPGTGKTTAAAELIRHLLDAGKRVGVTATSHAVIGNLLTAVRRPALQKCEEDQACRVPGVDWSRDNAVVESALLNGDHSLIGGSAWFWTRPALTGAVDVLIVDEAGQFSLANAVAVARSATSLVLLGDPQQLAQPIQAVHPGDSGCSALEHLLEGHATVPEDRGVFLDRTYRMHPALTAFVSDLAYEGRLESAAGRERIAVLGGGVVSGSGLAVRAVQHSKPSAAACADEARAVAELWSSWQGVGWVDAEGVERPIGADDVLVVAPYNNQVGLIRRLLPDGARVGTVDKFQGQEAPVVVYSMTSTSAQDAPRGVSFLYDLHRLNVAVSRAKALAVVVMSEQLLDAAVRTPEQLRQVNALCRLVEMATVRSATA
jgi:predicted RecB family nuclease